ncbi:FAD-dependent pyridine nucleotide-disulfide oxidoreductase [Clostridium scatologenes]|uniref:FAD-dependent pyridine nucleotide-disulfide oxidoreductase n=1 Tax=Clostridium scatologenes TaxID=1548 RepID=A0A0E3M8N5_CLOSL|nr:FAD-dependent pyridine nucleotide-disulfide oxidoreductase [Clostridium scatologenes]
MIKKEKKLDLLIIGSGPAGLTAAIYAARLKLKTLILEDELVGGQIKDAYTVENYPGFISISGSDLIDKIQNQAINYGVEIDEFDKIVSVKLTNNEKIIETKSYIYKPKAVIIAAGAKKRELPISEEKNFHGKGIHYCELCDGHLYEGKHIAVVGGGNSAVQAANFLSKYAKKITLIHKRNYLRADKKNQQELFDNKKVEILWNSKIQHAIGDNKLEAVLIENEKETYKLDLDGIFVYIGVTPRTDLYKDYLNLNSSGNIEASETCETNIKGVFAAGDVRTKPFRQLTTAVSDGTTAALMAEKYIKNEY